MLDAASQNLVASWRSQNAPPARHDGLEYAKRLKYARVATQMEYFPHSMQGFVSMDGLTGPDSCAKALQKVAAEFKKAVAV